MDERMRGKGTGEEKRGQAGEKPLDEGRDSREDGQVEGTPEAKLLREQELSSERQREGKAWHGLDPGQSSGTTARSDVSTEEMRSAHEGRTDVTPGAHRAENMGERKRPDSKESAESAEGTEAESKP